MYTEDKTIVELVKKYAPEGFNKRQVQVTPAEEVSLTGMNWSGGYKTDYVAVNLSSGDSADFPEPEWNAVYELRKVKMRAGIAIIAYQYSGLSKFVEVYLHPSNVVQQIEEKADLTPQQLAILYCTRAYKNSYGGETDLRRKEAGRAGYGFTPEAWRAEQDTLCKLGYLDRRGSLTTKGKNATPKSLTYKDVNS